MGQKIDKEVFDKFFKESYCTVEYETVKEEFERIASIGNDLFTGSYEARNLNRENFILYLTSDSYCDFEAAVQEAMDDLNPEILDAVMDVTEAQEDGDEITEVYWDTQRELEQKCEKEDILWRRQAVTAVYIMCMMKMTRPTTVKWIWMRMMRRD